VYHRELVTLKNYLLDDRYAKTYFLFIIFRQGKSFGLTSFIPPCFYIKMDITRDDSRDEKDLGFDEKKEISDREFDENR